MALDPNKTYEIPGWMLIALLALVGAGGIVGGYNFPEANAQTRDEQFAVQAVLSPQSVAAIAKMVDDEVCPKLEADLNLPGGSCTAAKVQARARHLRIMWDDHPQGGKVYTMFTSVTLPATVTIGME